jgi:hypothetical protein
MTGAAVAAVMTETGAVAKEAAAAVAIIVAVATTVAAAVMTEAAAAMTVMIVAIGMTVAAGRIETATATKREGGNTVPMMISIDLHLCNPENTNGSQTCFCEPFLFVSSAPFFYRLTNLVVHTVPPD